MSKNQIDEVVYQDADPVEMPENAFRELGEGEHYRPIMHPAHDYPEVTPYSVSMGLILAIIFSAAAAYLGLKVGQVFEAAIPIAIIAVGFSGALKKKNPLGQNVIIQSIGACSGVIVAGAIFTLPALYILQAKYPRHFSQLLPDISQFTAGRHPWHSLFHSFPQIFRKGYAWQISFP